MTVDVWEKIKDYSRLNLGKEIPLLNSERGSPFVIQEVGDTYLKISKLTLKLSQDVFLTVYDYLMAQNDWVLIGATRINTKPNTIEGVIKSTIFKGDMDALSTATYVAAILVYSDIGIKFNLKSRGQALKKN